MFRFQLSIKEWRKKYRWQPSRGLTAQPRHTGQDLSKSSDVWVPGFQPELKDYFKATAKNWKVYRRSTPSEGQRCNLNSQTPNRWQYWSTSENSASHHGDSPFVWLHTCLHVFPYTSPAAVVVSQEVSHRVTAHHGRRSCFDPTSPVTHSGKMRQPCDVLAGKMPELERHGQIVALPVNSWCYSPLSSPVPLGSLLQLHSHSHNTETPTRLPIRSSLKDTPLILLLEFLGSVIFCRWLGKLQVWCWAGGGRGGPGELLSIALRMGWYPVCC